MGTRVKRDSFKRDGSKRAGNPRSVGWHRPDRPGPSTTCSPATAAASGPWQPAPTGRALRHVPPALIEPCILAGAPFNGLVLDPFRWQRHHGRCRLQHGRRFIGCELNPDYIKLAGLIIAAAGGGGALVILIELPKEACLSPDWWKSSPAVRSCRARKSHRPRPAPQEPVG